MTTFQISRQTSDVSRLIVGAYDVYMGVKKVVNKVLLSILEAPIALILSYIIRSYRVSIEKSLRDLMLKEIDKDSYKEMRLAYDLNEKSLSKLKRFKQRELNQLPYSRKRFFKEVDKLIVVILDHHRTTKERLAQFDKLPEESDSVFTLVQEEKLWKIRTTTIEYMV